MTETVVRYASSEQLTALLETHTACFRLLLHWPCLQEYLVKRLTVRSDTELERLLEGPLDAFALPYLIQWLQRIEVAGWVLHGQVSLFDSCVGVHMRPYPRDAREIVATMTCRTFLAQLLPGDFERSIEVLFLD